MDENKLRIDIIKNRETITAMMNKIYEFEGNKNEVDASTDISIAMTLSELSLDFNGSNYCPLIVWHILYGPTNIDYIIHYIDVSSYFKGSQRALMEYLFTELDIKMPKEYELLLRLK